MLNKVHYFNLSVVDHSLCCETRRCCIVYKVAKYSDRLRECLAFEYDVVLIKRKWKRSLLMHS